MTPRERAEAMAERLGDKWDAEDAENKSKRGWEIMKGDIASAIEAAVQEEREAIAAWAEEAAAEYGTPADLDAAAVIEERVSMYLYFAERVRARREPGEGE